jgi:multiple sugar transport system substrate-binding protein
MKPNRWLALLAIAALAVTACGPGADDDDTDAAPDEDEPEGPVELTAIMEEVPDTDIVLDLIEEFEAETDITINVEALPYDQMRDLVITSSLAPEPSYDILIIDNPWMVDFANGGYVQPLDDLIADTDGYDYDDFAGPLRDIGEVDGEIYGVPFYNYALALIYRTDILEEVDGEVPTTIEEYQELVATITDETDTRGLAMQPQRGYKVFEEWANWLYAFGGRLTDDAGEVVLDSPEAREALEAYIETYEEAAPADSLNWGFDEALRSVAGGDAATMISYNWMLPTLNSETGPAGDLAGNFDVAEVPGGTAVLGAWHWAIAGNTPHTNAAWEFISWLTSPEIDTQRVMAGGAPIRMSTMEDPEVWEEGFGQTYYETVEAILSDAIPLATGPNAEEVIEIVGTHLNAAVAGQESVDDAISSAAAEAANAFEAGGS